MGMVGAVVLALDGCYRPDKGHSVLKKSSMQKLTGSDPSYPDLKMSGLCLM